MQYLYSIVIGMIMLAIGLYSLPYEWLNRDLRKIRVDMLGPPAWNASSHSTRGMSIESNPKKVFSVCDITQTENRKAWVVEGVRIAESKVCEPDSPWLVAASVLGTNNVSHATLMRSGLSPDGIVKKQDKDNDGDPDSITVVLEVIELNGFNPDTGNTTVSYDIAPGVAPTAWVFAPKTFGMSTESFDSDKATPLMRMPGPVIRVEQGDEINIVLENTHYMPHTIHFHGVDHPFLNKDGTGNDGVPLTSEMPVKPANSKTYSFKPRQAGTFFYHCHVHPDAHIVAGLQGMIVVEPKAANNNVQTLNVGAGHVRYPSVSVKNRYDNEFDLHYQDMDEELSTRMRASNDPHAIMQSVNIDYNVASSSMEYYLLNGKSFPYTFRESIVFIDDNEKVLLRVLNGGTESIALHTHGHKPKIVAADGVSLASGQQQYRDVHHIAPAQRVDLVLDATNDGLNSYGDGAWIFHDHFERGVTTAGISPGGNVSAVVYNKYLDEKGWPITFGMGWNKYFDASYYQGRNLLDTSRSEISRAFRTFDIFNILLGFLSFLIVIIFMIRVALFLSSRR